MHPEQHFNATLFELPAEIRLQKIRAIPKADLHAHMVLSSPFQTLCSLSSKPLTRPPARFNGLQPFLDWVNNSIVPLLDNPQHIQRMLADCLQHMKNDGICYTELSFDIRIPLGGSLSWKEYIEMWRAEIKRHHPQLIVSPELGIPRELPRELIEAQLEILEPLQFFDGFDLYGSELAFEINHFDFLFKFAEQKKWRVKIHSGEIGPGDRVAKEVAYARPYAIQHGINAVQHQATLTLLTERQVQTNVCPWSNIYLSLVENYQTHPIRALFHAGVPVTVATDDYAIFSKSLSEEYCALYDQGIFSASELEQIRLNGLRALNNCSAL
jgi:adenosine deaminase